MTAVWRVRALWFAVLGAGWMLGGVPVAAADETCVECHRMQRVARLRAPAEQLPESIHGRNHVTCSDCHGGRPDEPSARAHDLEAGFRARFAAGAQPAICGGCHSDALRMGAVEPGLPTDQLQLYNSSVHGRAFAAGNTRAATCAACHGAHDVRAVSDPASSVSLHNIAGTCGRCHSDRTLMSGLGMPHDEERQWRHSVHGRAYERWIARSGPGALARDERHPPTCSDCHSDHAVADRTAAVAGCRRCHGEMWQSFEAGPHKVGFERMGFLPCVDCHGSHEVSSSDASFIGVDRDTVCRRCHSEGQRMFETIRELGVEVGAAEHAADNARAALVGAPVGALESKLRPIDEARHALRLAIHSLNKDRIRAAATLLKTRAERIPVPTDSSSTVVAVVASWGPPAALVLLGVALLGVAFWRRRGGKK